MQDSHTQGIKWKNAWNAIMVLIVSTVCIRIYRRFKAKVYWNCSQYFSIYCQHVFFWFWPLVVPFFPKYEWGWCEKWGFYHELPWPLIRSIKKSLKLLWAPLSPNQSDFYRCKSWFHAHHFYAWLTQSGLQTHCLLSFLVAAHVGYRACHWQQMWWGPEKINLPTMMPSAEAKYWLSDL